MTLAVRRTMLLDADPEAAFALFTEGIQRWWPLRAGFAYGGDRAGSIHLEPRDGGRFFERLVDGDEIEVGRVTACDRPRHLAFSWRAPAWPAETHVSIDFRPEGGGTRIDLVHNGFELLGDSGQAVRDGFVGGWPRVLQALAAVARADAGR